MVLLNGHSFQSLPFEALQGQRFSFTTIWGNNMKGESRGIYFFYLLMALILQGPGLLK